MSGSTFTLVGLLLTLIGACLLFFYGLPKKRIGNVMLFGIMAMRFRDSEVRDLPDRDWASGSGLAITHPRVAQTCQLAAGDSLLLSQSR